MNIIYNKEIISNIYAIKIHMENTENVATLIDGLVSHRLENLKIEEDQHTPIEQAAFTVIAECGNEESCMIPLSAIKMTEFPDDDLVKLIKEWRSKGFHIPIMFCTDSHETVDDHEFYIFLFGVSDQRPDYNFVVATVNMNALYTEILRLHKDELDPELPIIFTPLFYEILNNRIHSAVSTDIVSLRAYIEKEDKEPDTKIAQQTAETVAEDLQTEDIE